MNIWLDDIRHMPEEFDIHCRTAQAAIAILKYIDIDVISFDHDLGSDLTGYDVAKFIEEQASNGRMCV